MKKTVLISLVLLVAVLLMAAVPAPLQRLSGTLAYSRASICQLPDYIALPVMENIYLKGLGFPTEGQYAGCHIEAYGRYVTPPSSTDIARGQCVVFQVSKSSIACPDASTVADTR